MKEEQKEAANTSKRGEQSYQPLRSSLGDLAKHRHKARNRSEEPVWDTSTDRSPQTEEKCLPQKEKGLR